METMWQEFENEDERRRNDLMIALTLVSFCVAGAVTVIAWLEGLI